MKIPDGLDQNWTRRALCKNNEMFTSYHIEDVNEACSICEECEVQVECIIAAASSGSLHIAAGLTHYDRLVIQWERARSEGDELFRGSAAYISEVLRRKR